MSRRKKENKIVTGIVYVVVFILCILGLSSLFNDDKTKTTSSNNVAQNKVNNVSNKTNNTVSNNNSVNNKINNNTPNTQNELENQIDEEEARLKEEEKKKQEELEKQNQIKAKDNKAISLAKKAWGEDSTVNFVIDEKNENGIYKISVVEKATTRVILWYEVNIITETVEETF